MANPVYWFEVFGKDPVALRKFYRNVFGWKVSEGNPNNKADYGLIEAEDGGVPGGIGSAPTRKRAFTTFVVEVKNPKVILAKAEKLGGRTLLAMTKVPGLDLEKGYIEDPEGNVICITRGGSE